MKFNKARELLMLFVALTTACSIPQAMASQTTSIQGSWRWRDDHRIAASAKKAAGSSQVLTFGAAGAVTGQQFFAAAFGSGRGEGLGSGDGRYRLSRGKLLIASPPERDIVGWPTRDGTYHPRMRCNFAMSLDNQSFALSNCPLSGVWDRSH